MRKYQLSSFVVTFPMILRLPQPTSTLPKFSSYQTRKVGNFYASAEGETTNMVVITFPNHGISRLLHQKSTSQQLRHWQIISIKLVGILSINVRCKGVNLACQTWHCNPEHVSRWLSFVDNGVPEMVFWNPTSIAVEFLSLTAYFFTLGKRAMLPKESQVKHFMVFCTSAWNDFNTQLNQFVATSPLKPKSFCLLNQSHITI